MPSMIGSVAFGVLSLSLQEEFGNLVPTIAIDTADGTVGTSTNLLVDGVAQAKGLAGFSIFEITPLAVLLVAWGAIYLRFAAPRLLPDRASLASLLSDTSKRKFFTELALPEDSALVGREVLSVEP